jgi:CheY-like chemotaxis protein
MDEALLIENLGIEFAHDLVDNRLTLFHNQLLALEEGGDCFDSDIYEETFRRFHGVKGTGGMYGMYCVSTVFHQLENYLMLLNKSGDHDKSDVYLKMHNELDLVDKMARAWIDGERDLRKFLIERKLSAHSNETVLILEPLKSVSDQIIAVLQDNGYETTLVNDGVKAMECLVLGSFDLFVTSEQNRFINGSELIAFIKINPRFSSIKTIYLSTESNNKWAVCAPDIIIKKDSAFIGALDAAIS